MITVCPQCQLTLTVTAADLRVAQGQVRCGRCAAVFNALVALYDEQPPVVEVQPAPEPVPEGSTPRLEIADLPPDTQTPAHEQFAAANDPELDPFAAANDPVLVEDLSLLAPVSGRDETTPDDDVPGIVVEEQAFESVQSVQRLATVDATAVRPDPVRLEPRDTAGGDPDVIDASIANASGGESVEPAPAAANRPWIAASVLLGLLLAAQLVHRNRETLAQQPSLRPLLMGLYASLGQPLDPRWDVHAFEVRQQGAFAEPAAPGTIVLRASVENRATRAQPMPLLRVSLLDRFAKPVAMRDLTATEYLGKPAGEAMLAAGGRVEATVAIADPSGEALGFELDACLPRSDGTAGVRCANSP